MIRISPGAVTNGRDCGLSDKAVSGPSSYYETNLSGDKGKSRLFSGPFRTRAFCPPFLWKCSILNKKSHMLLLLRQPLGMYYERMGRCLSPTMCQAPCWVLNQTFLNLHDNPVSCLTVPPAPPRKVEASTRSQPYSPCYGSRANIVQGASLDSEPNSVQVSDLHQSGRLR